MARQNSSLSSFARTHCVRLPRPIEDEWSWQRQGSCLDYPLAVFFPEDDAKSGLRRREEVAKGICRGCPVLLKCRDHALNTPEQHGVWGAMSARERARALRGQRERRASERLAVR